MSQMNSGPPPKDPATRARRNKPPTAAVQLPEGGRQGDTPEWPGCEDEQWLVWDVLWHTPQAAAWDRMGEGIKLVVMRYVCFLTARVPTAATHMEIRQLEDRLGLNPLAMRRLGWEVRAADIEPAQGTVATSKSARYEGLRAVAKVAE